MEKEHLEEYQEFLKNTKGLSDKTIADYTYWIKAFDVKLLSQDYINAYVQKRGNNSGIRGAVERFLEMTGLTKTYDMPPKMSGRKKQRIVRDVSLEEIERISNYLYTHSFRKGLMFELLYQGALRRDEVITIKINSFKWMRWIEDLTQFCQLIVKGKGDKERVVLINPETAEKILTHYVNKHKMQDMEQIRNFSNSNSYLFTHDGKPYSKFFVWKLVNKVSKKVLDRAIRPHELRHARATELERMGVPIRDIKNYLGHSSLATTEIYLHRSEKESIETIQNILKKK